MMGKPLGIILEDPQLSQFDLWKRHSLNPPRRSVWWWSHREIGPLRGIFPRKGWRKPGSANVNNSWLLKWLLSPHLARKMMTKFGLLKPDFSTFIDFLRSGDKKRGAPHISKERWCSHAGCHPVTGGTASSRRRCCWQGWVWNEGRAREHCAKKTQRPGVFHVHVLMISRMMIRCKLWDSHQLVAAFIWGNKTSSIGFWKTKPWRVKEANLWASGVSDGNRVWGVDCHDVQGVQTTLRIPKEHSQEFLLQSWAHESDLDPKQILDYLLCPDLLLPVTCTIEDIRLLFWVGPISLQWSHSIKSYKINGWLICHCLFKPLMFWAPRHLWTASYHRRFGQQKIKIRLGETFFLAG